MANRTYPIKINVGTRRVGFTHEEWDVILRTCVNWPGGSQCITEDCKKLVDVPNKQVIEVGVNVGHVASSNIPLGMLETFTETM